MGKEFRLKETWKDIAGYEGFYLVSNFGRIKSVAINRKYGKKTNRTIYCKPNIIKSGYCYTQLCKNGYSSRKGIQIHRLVANAFLPNPFNKPDVNHKDGNKQNNRVDNLEWVTKSENSKHAFENGFLHLPPPKLTIKIAEKIRSLYPFYNQYELAERFNISQTCVWSVVNNKRWILPDKEIIAPVCFGKDIRGQFILKW